LKINVQVEKKADMVGERVREIDGN